MTSKGVPTNAIHGFTNFLLKFLKQHQPTHLAVAWMRAARLFAVKYLLAIKPTGGHLQLT
jgi:DNA polymerase-1